MNRERRVLNFVSIKRNESQNMQNLIMKYELDNIKSKHLQKLINKVLDEHEERFCCCCSECKYDLSFRDDYGFEMHSSIYYLS